MTIQQTIHNYLEAVEKKFGREARSKTRLEYRGGTKFAIKNANAMHPTLINIARLKTATRYLQASAA